MSSPKFKPPDPAFELELNRVAEASVKALEARIGFSISAFPLAYAAVVEEWKRAFRQGARVGSGATKAKQ